MSQKIIVCPHCEKPIISDVIDVSLHCPYCDGEFNAKESRRVLLEAERDAAIVAIRSLIDEKKYVEARELAIQKAGSTDEKVLFYALILECDLLSYHPLYFSFATIDQDVALFPRTEDFEQISSAKAAPIRKGILDALKRFYTATTKLLDKHKNFVGERYDALTRLVFVSKCCLRLHETGLDTAPLAKECAALTKNLCAGTMGDVYNMPRQAFDEASKTMEKVSETFRFSAAIKLQDNPHGMMESPNKGKMVCPYCDVALPATSAKVSYVTCPSCRHRFSKEKALLLGTMTAPASNQVRLVDSIRRDDMNAAGHLAAILMGGDPQNADYALARMKAFLNEVTPLSLYIDSLLAMLAIVSKAKPMGYDDALKACAVHFKAILSILNEYADAANGPSKELLEALKSFIAQIER